MSEVENDKIIFKSKKKKQLRQRIKSESSDESDNERSGMSSKLEEMKDMQKLRKRPHGVSIVGLALGTKVSTEEEANGKDPFKIKSGGMLDMSSLKSGKIKRVDDAYDTGIGTQFSVETNKRDEDEEMMKYIEEQLSKRKGKDTPDNEIKIDATKIAKFSKYCTPEEAALQAVPKHLRESSTQRSEEMLSNQMLSGIPEVDLGIEAKIKNIEATEEAKLRLLWEKHNKKDGPSQFVPTNMAVNFVQHNRFNIDYGDQPKKKAKVEKTEEVAAKPEEKTKSKEKGERATDDYHYEKFRKQFRRF